MKNSYPLVLYMTRDNVLQDAMAEACSEDQVQAYRVDGKLAGKSPNNSINLGVPLNYIKSKLNFLFTSVYESVCVWLK